VATSVTFRDLRKTFTTEGRTTVALAGVTGAMTAGRVTGLVGPDGAGKTTLIRMLAGLLTPETGEIDIGAHNQTPARVAYMPQKFGLYEDLTVEENLTLYADLNGLDRTAREARFAELHRFTNLGPFTNRLAGKLSGGMKQKLGLACTLVVAPDVLLLDEPSVGVDPLSRRELWQMVRALQQTGITVLWSTAYLDEAERCDDVILLHEGVVLDHGPPAKLTARVDGAAWRIALPENGLRKRDVQRAATHAPGVVDAQIRGRYLNIVMDHAQVAPDLSAIAALRDLKPERVTPRFEDTYLAALRNADGEPLLRTESAAISLAAQKSASNGYVIETRDLTRRFGDFTAVDKVSFNVSGGEIFGLLGPNGAGKSTTFKMLCGLLPASSGNALVAGFNLGQARADARGRIGYMAQKFAYLGHLTVLQNMTFAGGVYGLSGALLNERIDEALATYNLGDYRDAACGDLPLGIKQRLALACAVLHRPAILFLDEPTSGVDPITRREFWGRINAMADEGVTVLVTSHFLDEAEYCDRMIIIYRGRLVASGSPDEIKSAGGSTGAMSLEDAFIALIENYDREHPQ
jgi:ABC-2 type transport system ATP-binding protein